MNLWQTLVGILQEGGWEQLVVLFGVVVALILFVCLQLMLIKGRRSALRALGAVRDMMEDIRGLEEQLDDLERRAEKRFDSRTVELDARMTRKIDQKGDLIQERIEQQGAAHSESISKLEARVSRATEEVGGFRERITEVEGRIPGLFDRLDEFRDTLAKTFQAELSGVLTSFDSSISGILEQMKSELQMGVSRIESIESMVRSRERAERTLLGSATETALPASLSEEEQEFEEWEQQAKELAEAEEAQQAGDVSLEATPLPPEEQESEYPAEMGETGGEAPPDDLEADLYPEEPEAPEGEEGAPEEE